MLKRLKLKFVVINMTIVTIMLSLVFGLLIHFTEEDLEQNSLNMMHSVVRGNMMMPGRPDIPPSEIRLPFFIIRSNNEENTVFGGGFFDLSDEALIEELLETSAVSSEPVGVIEEYNLRYMRINTPDFQQIIFSDISSEISTMKNLRHTCILIGTASFLAFLAISIILANWAVKPVEKSWQQQKQFVADASHELKTPLASIKLLSDSILQYDMDMETVKEFVGDIGNEADRLTRMTTKLLALTKGELSSDLSDAEIIYMAPTMERVAKMLSGIATENQITIETDLSIDSQVLIPEDDLYQIAFNLAENGIKYNIPGGKLHISLHRQEDNAIVRVSDTGMGIPPEAISHVFERFYRVDKARSRQSGGSGLGLAIVRSIVERNNGQIHLQSTLGKGTTFTVEFPCFDIDEEEQDIE